MRFAFLFVPLLVLTGCHPSMRVARNTAADDFDCEDLHVRKRAEDLFVIDGCGRRGVYQCPTGPGVSSRYCVNLMLMAKHRAEAEFECTDLSAREISPFVFRVEGCGQVASYHCEAEGAQPRCLREADPVEETAVESADPVEAAAPAPVDAAPAEAAPVEAAPNDGSDADSAGASSQVAADPATAPAAP